MLINSIVNYYSQVKRANGGARSVGNGNSEKDRNRAKRYYIVRVINIILYYTEQYAVT